MEDNYRKRKAYIFDVDGTLYSQRKMHFIMAYNLFTYYIRHIKNCSEIAMVLQFRYLREKEEYKTASIETLIKIIADSQKANVNYVQSVIRNWMFDRPAEYLMKCAYKDVLEFIENVIRQGAVVVIYSDYPAKNKLHALRVMPDYVFSSEDSQIHELKPSKRTMKYILEVINIPKEQILYIGDRDEKDGSSAKYAEIPYVNIHKFRKYLKRMA